MMDPDVRSQFNQLKGLILQVKKNTLPSVDFCCDMFDRRDSSVLTGYWDDGRERWTIRNRKLVQQAPVATSTDTAALIVSFSQTVGSSPIRREHFNSVSACCIPIETNSSRSTALYLAAMESADMYVALDFDVYTGVHDSGVSESYNAGTNIVTFSQTRTAVGAAFGVCFGDIAERVLGVVGSACYAPSISSQAVTTTLNVNATPITSVSAPSASADDFMISRGEFTDNTTTFESVTPELNTRSFFQSYSPGFGFVYNADYNGLLSEWLPKFGVVAGSNRLLVVANANHYDFYLNGSLWFSRDTKLMPFRNRVGINCWSMNLLQNILTFGFPYSGITSFKAWPIGKPEPPDQTGHGVYVDNGFQYQDKYHDSDGNYNPEA